MLTTRILAPESAHLSSVSAAWGTVRPMKKFVDGTVEAFWLVAYGLTMITKNTARAIWDDVR